MTEHLLAQSLLLILASALAVGFFAASRMPAAMGYLLAGLSIGPYGLNLVAPGDDTRFLAELGLIFLLFQDIATIPLLVAVDSWSRQSSVAPFDLVRRLGLAAIALAAVAIIARPL